MNIIEKLSDVNKLLVKQKWKLDFVSQDTSYGTFLKSIFTAAGERVAAVRFNFSGEKITFTADYNSQGRNVVERESYTAPIDKVSLPEFTKFLNSVQHSIDNSYAAKIYINKNKVVS